MHFDEYKICFYECLSQPQLGFSRGILPYNLALILPFLFFAQQCFVRTEEVFEVAFLFSPLLVLAHEMAFRSSRLPRPVAAAYDALFSDILQELTAQHCCVIVYSCLDSIISLLRYITAQVVASFWFMVSLVVLFSESFRAFLTAMTRSAHDSMSIHRSILLSQSHSIRAPSFLLN